MIDLHMQSFKVSKWRGENRYFFIVAYAFDISKQEVNLTNLLTDSSQETGDYWTRKYYTNFNLPSTLEEYTNYGINCIYENITRYAQQDSRQNISLDGLHPYINYTILIFPCNEIQDHCYLENPASIDITTPEYKPSQSCANISTEVLSSTELRVNFSPIDWLNRNGIILKYRVRLYCHRINITYTKYINNTNEELQYVDFDGLEKYEQCCAWVSGYTSYHEVGIENQHDVCNLTLEDGKLN